MLIRLVAVYMVLVAVVGAASSPHYTILRPSAG